MRYRDLKQDAPTIMSLCRREGYDYIRNQRVYCGMESQLERLRKDNDKYEEPIKEHCIYRDEKLDDIGHRCMLLEKQWR